MATLSNFPYAHGAEEAGDVAGLACGIASATSGVCRATSSSRRVGGPGEQSAVPERARRHQVERPGVRLLGEARHRAGAVVERRAGDDVAEAGLGPGRHHADRDQPGVGGDGGGREGRVRGRNAAPSPTTQSACSDSTSLSGSRRARFHVAQMSAGAVAVGFGLLLLNQRTDAIGILLSGPDATRRGIVEALARLGQPLVVFQETLRFAGADLCVIRQADREGGRLVGREVLRLGARRLAMLAPAIDWPAIGERIEGVRDATREVDGPVEFRVVRCGDADLQDTQAALAQDIALHGQPDAILAGNDQMGIAAMKLMAARGLAMPRDVAITGFNAFDFWQYTEPVLTTVRSRAYEMGARGGEEILKRLSGGSFERREIVYPVELQRGGST